MKRLRPSTTYLLHQTSQALRSRLEHGFRPLGVTGLQYTILALLMRHEGLSSADLSRRFFVTPQTMNQIVASMTRRGLVARQPSAHNKRILRMHLTPAGRELLARCETIADAVEREALASVPEGQLMAMRADLSQLLRHLREAARAAPATLQEPPGRPRARAEPAKERP